MTTKMLGELAVAAVPAIDVEIVDDAGLVGPESDDDDGRCPDCGGAGWKITPRGAVKCLCLSRADRLRDLVRVPIRFQGCTVANYRVNAALKPARDAVVKWINGYAPRGPGLLLLGPTGTGKTHLATAALLALAENKRIPSSWLSVSDWLASLRSMISNQSGGVEDVIADVASQPLVLLDDIGAERWTDFAGDTITRVMAARYNEARPTILTANLSWDGLEKHIGPRIASRLKETCVTVEVNGGDYRIKLTPETTA